MSKVRNLTVSGELKGLGVVNYIYPIGSVYCTNDSSFDPNDKYPGTKWERISLGRCIVGVDTNDEDFNTVDREAGEERTTLTIETLPKHAHDQYVTANSGTAGVRADYLSDHNTDIYGQHKMGYRGNGKSHNNLQPYIVVAYWQRSE